MPKKFIWIGAGILVLGLIVALLFFWFITGPGKKPVAAIVIPQGVSALATPEMTPSATQTTVPTAISTSAGDIWQVVEISKKAIHENGFDYDVATFSNVGNPAILMKAQCGAPGWPSPKIGQQYVLNDYNVLVPEQGIGSPLQRFYPIK